MTFVNSKLTEITTNFYFIVSEDIQKEFRCISSRHWQLWYTWIGYLQVNGPPWALPSNCVDHRFLCANIDLSQIARTLKWPKPFQDVFSCYFSYWPDVCGASHLTSAWLPTLTAGWWCQGCEAPPAAAQPWYRQHDVIPVSGDMISHHAPHETGKLTRNRCFSYIVFLTFSKNHFVVSAP